MEEGKKAANIIDFFALMIRCTIVDSSLNLGTEASLSEKVSALRKTGLWFKPREAAYYI